MCRCQGFQMIIKTLEELQRPNEASLRLRRWASDRRCAERTPRVSPDYDSPGLICPPRCQTAVMCLDVRTEVRCSTLLL